MMPTFFPLSASALLMTVGERIDVALTHRIARFVALLDHARIAGVRDIVPSHTTVLVEYDSTVNYRESLAELLYDLWHRADAAGGSGLGSGRVVDIPIVYGGAHGPDLDRMAQHAGLPSAEVTRRHAAAEYTVGALGFAPGFAYLIGLPPELATPRLERPRLTVPAGSVGIGGAQTGIYALPTPGGWSLIGRTPLRLFDPDREDPFLLRMGDRVRFRPIAAVVARWPTDAGSEAPQARSGALEVVEGGLQTTVQDLGRPGYGRFGVTLNGAADRASLVAANRLVGNPDGAAALEITLLGPRLRFHRPVTIVLAGADLGASLAGRPLPPGERRRALPGDELAFGPAPEARGMRAYLAVAGGIDVPVVMGSRSTDLTAGLGGHLGRALRAGDWLAAGGLRRHDRPGRPRPTVIDPAWPIRVLRGPQADRFSPETWRRFVTSEFTVSSESNRVGLRLVGPPLFPTGGADIVSEGIVTGAIQVTGAGQPIIMLPGHATIGGYTKIATVIDEDLDRLGQLRPGDVIRFREVSLGHPAIFSPWPLPALVRLARMASDRRVKGFAFEDHGSGARLRMGRGTPADHAM